MGELKIAYKLYALELTREGIKTASEQRFCRITPFYVLVYTDGDAPQDSIEITEEETNRLTKQDEQWLLDCNTAILMEQMHKHEAEISKDVLQRMEKWEQELEKRAKAGEMNEE